MDRNDLKNIRIYSGSTQSQMAEAMGLPLRTYEDLEAGRSQLRPVHEKAALYAKEQMVEQGPARIEGGPLVLVHIVVDRDGDPLGRDETLVVSFDVGVEVLKSQQAAFAHSGYTAMHKHYWARNDDEPFRLHKWWIEFPKV